MTDDPAPARAVSLRSGPGRWVVLSCVLGSGLAGIDQSVVNIALPDIGHDLGVGFGALQWTVTAYTLTLAAVILLGGALGDRYGRRRIYVIGIAWFAVASAGCAAAPTVEWLVAARALQGVGGALLIPGSLAIIQSVFVADDRSRAIGAWSGLAGAAAAIAPFLGGWLLAVGSWRWVFLINPPLAVLVAAIAMRHIPETRDPHAAHELDIAGSVLGIVGLGGVTAGMIEAESRPLSAPLVWVPFLLGVLVLVIFGVVEDRVATPLVPLTLFRSATFSATNAVTFLLYATNGGVFLLLVVELEVVSGFSPLRAGVSLLPVTVIMLGLSSRFGQLAQRIGPRLLLSSGAFVSAVGLVLMTRLGANSAYWTGVFPPVAVFGFGLAMFVAPLTATVLAAAPEERAGVASGVNNAVARVAGLISVAALPVLAGVSDDSYRSAHAFLGPFRTAVWICVGLQIGAGVLAAVFVPKGVLQPDSTDVALS